MPETLLSGQQVSGFVVRRIEPLLGLRATVVQCEHLKSGARLLHVHTPQDSENGFSVTFSTPPVDDTGLPHILEHAMLGGSRKFPVREPFFEMVKMSMATFINAMTAQAYTTYPVSSNVKKDFFNLAEVYLDAVFYPELREDTFRREGHHLSLENNSDLASSLKVTGIVYNEMKGAYSAPESLMWELAGRGLCPDTPLGRDSGGDPDYIPELTYEQFCRFHRELYHPSNALIFLYGDILIEEHLKFLSPVLDEFDRRPAIITTPRQSRWTAPCRMERDYPVGAAEDTAGRTFFTLNWLLGDALDADRVMEWEVLAQVLLGTEAAPLKKALIDSQLGADVFFAGAWAAAYEQEFHVGLKGSEPDRVEKFEQLVLTTLERIAGEPLRRELVESAFQQLAYDHLEVKTLFPINLLHLVNASWPYGGDPLLFLRMKEHLDACRQRYEADPQLFNHLIRTGLLENPHRLLVALRPDRECQARADTAFAAKMAEKRATLSAEEIAGIAREAERLEASQGEPNSPEALAKLPQLKVSDLPAKPRHIPTTAGTIAGIEALRNDVFSNGVNYLECDVDLAGLPVELYPWLPRFCEAVNKMGAAGQNFMQIAERRAACTGGLWCYPIIWRHASDPSRTLRRLRFGMKTLDDQASKALQLLGDLAFSVDAHDRDRLRDVLTQTRAAYRSALVNEGLDTARRQAARGLSVEGAISQMLSGPEALRAVEDMANRFDARADEIAVRIEQIRKFLANQQRWTVSFTGSDGAFKSVTRTMLEWSEQMRSEPVVDVPVPFAPFVTPPREGWAGPMQVAYCVKAMTGPHLAEPEVPLFRIGVYLARFDYFLPEIRFKGNAYGAGVSHDDSQGIFWLHSYRDPRIVETLAVFDGLHDWVAAQQWTQTDIDRAIIGSAKDVERPIRPGEATGMALARHLRGDTNELRERRYETTLSATPAMVKESLLRLLDANESRAAVCVVSSREKLAEANRTLGERALGVTDILG